MYRMVVSGRYGTWSNFDWTSTRSERFQ
ncbi:hypothetical protein MAR_010470 [Mya arenaria]|uniref:Uncharacterized protein n=1 Tax=Mya arenaria TaxID=6604 RepID=A0ABY7E539_MYAAR|nr:hypothetical protein MAR_010470 [Mya arenaria]